MNILDVFKARHAPERNRLNNTANTYQNSLLAAAPDLPPVRVVERKIGRATFIVSSRFGEGIQKDIVSTIARLVQHDSTQNDRRDNADGI